MGIKELQNSVVTNSDYFVRVTRNLRFDVNKFIILLLLIRCAINLFATIVLTLGVLLIF